MPNFSEALVVNSVGLLSKLVLRVFTRMTVVNSHVLTNQLLTRGPDKPAITLMNHKSTLDDPILWGALLPLRYFVTLETKLRWVLGARELTFQGPVTTWFFKSGRTIPIVRGAGIFHVGVEQAIEKMNKEATWLHVFPEAYINQTDQMLPLKWGIARILLCAEPGRFPLVVPIWHTGLEKVFPAKKLYYPRPGHEVRVLVGQPLELESFILEQRKAGVPEHEIRAALMVILTKEMLRLKAECEGPGFHQLAAKK